MPLQTNTLEERFGFKLLLIFNQNVKECVGWGLWKVHFDGGFVPREYFFCCGNTLNLNCFFVDYNGRVNIVLKLAFKAIKIYKKVIYILVIEVLSAK